VNASLEFVLKLVACSRSEQRDKAPHHDRGGVDPERTEGSVHVVGERSVRLRRQFEKTAGGIRSANADMSSVKAGEKPARRKPKVSCSTFIGAG
jgi:hypothetical protein